MTAVERHFCIEPIFHDKKSYGTAPHRNRAFDGGAHDCSGRARRSDVELRERGHRPSGQSDRRRDEQDDHRRSAREGPTEPRLGKPGAGAASAQDARIGAAHAGVRPRARSRRAQSAARGRREAARCAYLRRQRAAGARRSSDYAGVRVASRIGQQSAAGAEAAHLAEQYDRRVPGQQYARRDRLRGQRSPHRGDHRRRRQCGWPADRHRAVEKRQCARYRTAVVQAARSRLDRQHRRHAESDGDGRCADELAHAARLEQGAARRREEDRRATRCAEFPARQHARRSLAQRECGGAR